MSIFLIWWMSMPNFLGPAPTPVDPGSVAFRDLSPTSGPRLFVSNSFKPSQPLLPLSRSDQGDKPANSETTEKPKRKRRKAWARRVEAISGIAMTVYGVWDKIRSEADEIFGNERTDGRRTRQVIAFYGGIGLTVDAFARRTYRPGRAIPSTQLILDFNRRNREVLIGTRIRF